MVSRRPWVGGNWKCNGTNSQIEELVGNLGKIESTTVDVAVFPTAIHLSQVATKLGKSSNVQVGSQNVSRTSTGAYTGELAASILKDAGIGLTLVGHSERRTLYNETDAVTAEKVKMAEQEGLQICFCIGETLQERESGKTNEVCNRQLQEIIPVAKNWKGIVIAYEPVWAIGTGKVATPEQAQEAHQNIRSYLQKNVSAEVAQGTRIVYGGSVTGKNCVELMKQADIDGFLVGGASLKPEFLEIVAAASK